LREKRRKKLRLAPTRSQPGRTKKGLSRSFEGKLTARSRINWAMRAGLLAASLRPCIPICKSRSASSSSFFLAAVEVRRQTTSTNRERIDFRDIILGNKNRILLVRLDRQEVGRLVGRLRMNRNDRSTPPTPACDNGIRVPSKVEV